MLKQLKSGNCFFLTEQVRKDFKANKSKAKLNANKEQLNLENG